MEFTPGPFYMRGWGAYVNWIMVIWTAFEVIILVFPTVKPITAINMNYAVRLRLRLSDALLTP